MWPALVEVLGGLKNSPAYEHRRNTLASISEGLLSADGNPGWGVVRVCRDDEGLGIHIEGLGYCAEDVECLLGDRWSDGVDPHGRSLLGSLRTWQRVTA